MQRKKNDYSRIIITVVFGVFSMFFLIPLVWMLSAASKVENEVWTFPIQWIPETWNFMSNFKEVWQGDVPFYLFYFNSLKVAIIATLLTLVISSMAGFAFAKLKFPGKNIVFALLLSFMMIPEQSTLVPRYMMINWLGIYNTHSALIVLVMFSIYFTFLIRQFMVGINSELLEAAEIDGAGFFRIFWSIVLPLAKPILATVGIIKFIWTWNDYQTPLIFLYSPELYTIPLGIQLFNEEYVSNIAVTMMASLSAIIPMLIVFVILQKHVIKGISLGGVKG